jgi:P-type Cu+ transporter
VALAELKKEGIRVVMLTGDNRTTAEVVARRLGIAEVQADVLLEQKRAMVERLKRERRVVAMAGHGVNDAPALAARGRQDDPLLRGERPGSVHRQNAG